MITVPEATEKIVKRSRYLSEALSKDIINISSLARYIKPEIEGMLIKEVSLSSIIMALKRLSGKTYPHTKYEEIFKDLPQISVRTNLSLMILSNTRENRDFIYETNNLKETVGLSDKPISSEQDVSKSFYPVSSISIPLPKKAMETPGIYYFLIKSLAWERINILQLFTTTDEFVIIVEDRELQRALDIIRSIFKEDLTN